MWFVVLFFTAFQTGVMSIGLPEYIKSCSRNDPNLNECALQSARESIHRFALGDSSRGFAPLDPLYVEEIIVYIPDERGLKIVFKDNYFKGLSGLELQNLKFDLKKKLIVADALVNLDVQNNYELSGKFLIMSINSDGDSSIKLKNTILRIRYWYEHVELADGKIHWNITRDDIKYEVEKASFRLENLLGHKSIGEQINKLLNEMWREIIADVGPSICRSLSTAVAQNLKVLLEQVSYDEFMPE